MKIYIILEKLSNIAKCHHFDEILCNFADNSNKLWREVFPDEICIGRGTRYDNNNGTHVAKKFITSSTSPEYTVPKSFPR